MTATSWIRLDPTRRTLRHSWKPGGRRNPQGLPSTTATIRGRVFHLQTRRLTSRRRFSFQPSASSRRLVGAILRGALRAGLSPIAVRKFPILVPSRYPEVDTFKRGGPKPRREDWL